jgi:hypothetical protein
VECEPNSNILEHPSLNFQLLPQHFEHKNKSQEMSSSKKAKSLTIETVVAQTRANAAARTGLGDQPTRVKVSEDIAREFADQLNEVKNILNADGLCPLNQVCNCASN